MSQRAQYLLGEWQKWLIPSKWSGFPVPDLFCIGGGVQLDPGYKKADERIWENVKYVSRMIEHGAAVGSDKSVSSSTLTWTELLFSCLIGRIPSDTRAYLLSPGPMPCANLKRKTPYDWSDPMEMVVSPPTPQILIHPSCYCRFSWLSPSPFCTKRKSERRNLSFLFFHFFSLNRQFFLIQNYIEKWQNFSKTKRINCISWKKKEPTFLILIHTPVHYHPLFYVQNHLNAKNCRDSLKKQKSATLILIYPLYFYDSFSSLYIPFCR